MTHYYVAAWVGAGTAEDPYRPNVPFPHTGLIDLRPDPTSPAGYCFLASDVSGGDPPGGVHLGDDLSVPLPNRLRNRASNALGFSVRGLSIADVLMQTLTEEGRTDGTRWRPLRAARRRSPLGITDRWEIHLGGLAWSRELPVPAGGATYAESFNKADSTVLGPDLTWTEVAGDFTIVTNAAEHKGSNSTRHRARAEHDAAGVDMYVQAAFTIASHDAYGDGGIASRWNPTAQTHYAFMREYATTAPVINDYAYDLRKFVTGTETRLTTKTQRTPVAGEVLRGEAQGSTITYSIDGTTVVTHTDTSIDGTTVGGRRAGLVSFRGGGGKATWVTRWDNFEAGDLAAGGTVHELVPVDAAHVHSADTSALTQTHGLTPVDGAHGHAADAASLTQSTALVPVDAAHADSADVTSLTLTYPLAPADAAHPHRADSTAFPSGIAPRAPGPVSLFGEADGFRVAWPSSPDPAVTKYVVRRAAGNTPPATVTDGTLVAEVLV